MKRARFLLGLPLAAALACSGPERRAVVVEITGVPAALQQRVDGWLASATLDGRPAQGPPKRYEAGMVPFTLLLPLDQRGLLGIEVRGVSDGQRLLLAGRGEITVGEAPEYQLRVPMTGPFCSADGWCWENPAPQGHDLEGVTGTSAQEAWAVGQAGTILRWDGAFWTPEASGTTRLLHGAWTSPAGTVWVVGDEGTILRRSGGAWTAVPSGTMRNLYRVWGSGEDDIWAAGDFILLRWQGGSFRPFADVTGVQVRGLWGTGKDDVWACGDASGQNYHQEPGLYGPNAKDPVSSLLHFDGVRWSSVGDRPGGLFVCSSLWAGGPRDVWLGGARYATQQCPGSTDLCHYLVGADLVRWDGSTWSATAARGLVSGVWGSGTSDVWAVGQRNERFDGQGWALTAENRNRVRGVWGTGPRDGIAVGDGGTIQRWNGTLWNEVSPGTTPRSLRDAWGTGPDDIWAVGSYDTLLHWDGRRFTEHRRGDEYFDLFGVWGSGKDDVWAVGEKGKIIHWTGGPAWTLEDSKVTETLRGVFGTGPEDIWAVGDRGTMVRYQGKGRGGWQVLNSGTTADLRRIWVGAGGTDVWVIGGGGTVRRLRDGTWLSVANGTPMEVNAIWAADSSEVWLAGSGGALGRLRNGAWSAVTFPSRSDLHGLFGSGKNVWAVGADGTIVRWDGGALTLSAQASGTRRRLLGVWGSGPEDIWAVGDLGAVLHRRPR